MLIERDMILPAYIHLRPNLVTKLDQNGKSTRLWWFRENGTKASAAEAITDCYYVAALSSTPFACHYN